MVDAPEKVWVNPHDFETNAAGKVQYVRADRLEALERENAEQKDNLTFWKGVAASNAEWADKERVAREAAERRNAELEADNLRLQNEWDNCDEMLQATRADKARLSEALTPSGATKAAYLGDFYERIEVANPNHEDDEDEPETLIRQVPVSWTTIKEIMAAISARAALAGSGGGWPVAEGYVLVPVELSRQQAERMAREWGYTVEEACEVYAAIPDLLTAAQEGR